MRFRIGVIVPTWRTIGFLPFDRPGGLFIWFGCPRLRGNGIASCECFVRVGPLPPVLRAFLSLQSISPAATFEDGFRS